MPPATGDLNPASDWRIALARVEGKLDAIITANAALTVSVTDIDRRVRDVEITVAAMRQQLTEIEQHEAPRVNWTAIVSTLAAVLAVALIIGDRIYSQGGTP